MKTQSKDLPVLLLLLAGLLFWLPSSVVGRVGYKLSNSRRDTNDQKRSNREYGPTYRALGSCVRGEQLALLDESENQEQLDGNVKDNAEDDEDESTSSDDGDGDDDDDHVGVPSATFKRSKQRGARSKLTTSSSSYVDSVNVGTHRKLKSSMSMMSMMSGSAYDDDAFVDDDDSLFDDDTVPRNPPRMMRMMRRRRMRMRNTVVPAASLAPAISQAPALGSPSPTPSPVPTTRPSSPAPSITAARSPAPSTAAPAPSATTTLPTTTIPTATGRTRPPFQPRRMRMRMRRPMRAPRRSMGMSKGNTRAGDGGEMRLTVQAFLEYNFFPGTGMDPTNFEINALVDETEDFYLDTFDERPLTRNAPVTDFRMTNLAAQYAPGGDLDKFILYFNAQAFVPSNSGLNSDDIARVMANANYRQYLQSYVWEADPFTQNIFFQVGSVFFQGQGVFFFS